MPDLVGDLLCILEHAGAPGAIAVGYAKSRGGVISSLAKDICLERHDWGAQLAYEAARERPDIFTAVVGITIPVIPLLRTTMCYETKPLNSICLTRGHSCRRRLSQPHTHALHTKSSLIRRPTELRPNLSAISGEPFEGHYDMLPLHRRKIS